MPQRKLAVTQNTFKGTDFATDVDLIARAGIPAIGVTREKLREVGLAEAKRLIRGAGLSVSNLAAEGGFVPDGPTPAVISRARASIEAAAELGAGCIEVVSGPIGDLPVAEADRMLLACLDELIPVARQCGVRLAIEPVHPVLRKFSYIHRLDDAYRLAAHDPALGVALDTYHVFWDSHLPDEIAAHAGATVLVQLGDANTDEMNARRMERERLGHGAIHLREILHALDAAGYTGYYEIELPFQLSNPEPAALLQESRAWFEQIWD